MKKTWLFIWNRWSSFTFTLGSIGYGFYHFFRPNILLNSGAYQAINYITGLIGGKYLGLLFIVIGCYELYGIIIDNTSIKLSLYFALLFLWIALSVGFFLAFIQGYDNAAWIYTSIVASLSTNILSTKQVINGRGTDE